jgi:hypothetical protein
MSYSGIIVSKKGENIPIYSSINNYIYNIEPRQTYTCTHKTKQTKQNINNIKKGTLVNPYYKQSKKENNFIDFMVVQM